MADADIELWLGGNLVACSMPDLAADLPVVLDGLTINWGRQTMWDEPDEGACSFRLADNRRAGSPLPLSDIVHIGQPFSVYAVSPDGVASSTVITKDFVRTAGTDFTKGSEYDLDEFEFSQTFRTNMMTDPSMTTTSGKTAGGSATLAVSAAWAQFGTTSISVTPNGVSNASAVFPLGGTGLTVFVPGKTYRISAYIRITAVQTGTLNADARKIRIHQSTGGATTIVATSTAAPNTIGVHRLTLTYAVPANATQLVFSVCNGTSVAAQVMWVDGVLIEDVTDGLPRFDTYFDGATTDTTGYTYLWSGGADASASWARYNSSDPAASATARNSGGSHTSTAELNNLSTRVNYLWGPLGFGAEWFRDIRPMLPGETWTYSIDVLLPAGVQADLIAQMRPNGYPEADHVGEGFLTTYLTFDGGALEYRRVTGTGAWVTYTGTVTVDPDAPSGGFPVFGLTAYPEGEPTIDTLRFTAPAIAEDRRVMMKGRISNVDVTQTTSRGTIEMQVTGTGGVSELANWSIGDEPWEAEFFVPRIRRIVDLIPPTGLFLQGGATTTVSWDVSFGLVGLVAARDVDAQPVLGLLQAMAISAGGVAWPLYHEAVPAHLWLEDANARDIAFIPAGERVQIDACNIDLNQFRLGQSPDTLITVVEVGWKDIDDGDVVAKVTDDAAIEIYGYRLLRVQTEFATLAEAESVGQAILDRARATDWTASGVTIQGDQIVQQYDLMRLLDGRLRPVTLVEVSNLPEYVPDTIAAGWLEGGTISYTGGRWFLELFLSAADTSP